MIGETLGRYEIIEHLGRGSMAEVYKARHVALGRIVAIKVLHPFLTEEEDFRLRFQREAQTVATLRHPNIVQVYDFDHDAGRGVYYMVMEYIDGPSLKTRLREVGARGERMPLEEAVRVVAAVGEALEYAHQRGVVHRDIKPGNVMFNSDGLVILMDFGIARMINAISLTATGAVAGTPAYLSPEQANGLGGDARSDLYSLGVVLYEMVTGRLPFEADTPLAVALKHVNEPVPSARAVRAELSEALDGMIRRALAKRPEQRYQTAAEFVAELRAVPLRTPAAAAPVDDSPTAPQPVTPRPTAPTPPAPVWPVAAAARPTRRRRRWVAVLLAALIVLLLAAVLLSGRLSGWRSGGGSPTPTFVVPPTPNVTATYFAATLEAIQNVQATLTAQPTVSPLATPGP